MSIEEAIKEALVPFLLLKERQTTGISGYREKIYYADVEVEIYYMDTDYDHCTYTYYGTLGQLIQEIE